MKKVRFTYNFLFTIAFLLSAPYYFWRLRRRGHWQKGFAQRFGKFDTAFKQSITNRHVVWLHAVSVGEVNLCARIVHALELRMPNLKLITSTTTTTGMGELKKNLPTRVGKFYYPIDRRPYVHRALAALHPEAVVLVESEICPCLSDQRPALRPLLFTLSKAGMVLSPPVCVLRRCRRPNRSRRRAAA